MVNIKTYEGFFDFLKKKNHADHAIVFSQTAQAQRDMEGIKEYFIELQDNGFFVNVDIRGYISTLTYSKIPGSDHVVVHISHGDLGFFINSVIIETLKFAVPSIKDEFGYKLDYINYCGIYHSANAEKKSVRNISDLENIKRKYDDFMNKQYKLPIYLLELIFKI